MAESSENSDREASPAEEKRQQRPRSKFMTQWRHIAVIDREIRSGGYPSAPEIARDLELSARTVKRHIEFMRYDLGAPISYDASEKGYYYREPDWLLPPIKVSEGELFAIVLAERALRGIKNADLAEKIRRVFQKIAIQLPDEVQLSPSELAQDVGFQPGHVAPPDPELFDALARALRDGRTVRVDYHKLGADETVERSLDPYLLRCIDGEWYLVAHSHETGYVSLFHTNRIKAWEETGETFDREAVDFDPDEYFEHSLGASHSTDAREVAIRFSGWPAHYVAEREWHPGQQTHWESDGSLVLRMELGWLQEVATWVMQFADHAEVLKPPELRQMVQQRLRRALRQYESD